LLITIFIHYYFIVKQIDAIANLLGEVNFKLYFVDFVLCGVVG
jgi:hypothetical protein